MLDKLEHKKIMERAVSAAVFCLILDQMHKFFMLEVFEFEKLKYLKLTPFLNFVMVWNRGISFGMFQGHAYSNYFFMGFSSIIILALFFFVRKSKSITEASGYGMIIGGALGNLMDRIRIGAVADFYDFHYAGYHWPVFNIADSCVFLGAVLLIVSTFKKDKSKNESTNEK